MKRLILFAASLLLLPSCADSASSPASSEESTPVSSVSTTEPFVPKGDLQKVFASLQQGNFSVEYTLSYASLDHDGSQEAKYTEYAIETDGFYGFNAVAQGDHSIFPYHRENGTIHSLAPVLNPNSGLRYEQLADYRTTFRDFDLSYLPTEPDDDGFYTYAYGQNESNDAIINSLVMLYSSGSLNPSSVRFQVIGNSLIAHGIGLVYGEGIQDEVRANFMQIGTTEINDVKNFLEEGGTAKDYVSDRFVAFLLPYFLSQNFAIDVDLSSVNSASLPTRSYHKLFTPESEYSYAERFEDGTGYVQYMGVVSQFSVDEEGQVEFGAIAQADTSGTPMRDLWAEEIGQSFLSLNPANLLGYQSKENGIVSYHLEDTQFISALANLGNVGYSDAYYVDEVILTVDDWEKGEFTAEFPYYNLSTHQDLGSAFLSFHSLGQAINQPVADLLNEGDDPSSQTKGQLQQALDLFSTHSYRQYAVSDYSLVEYAYQPSYAYYRYVTDKPDTGEGYLLDHDGTLKGFTLKEGSLTIGNQASGELPGTGPTYGDDSDFAYFSAPTVYSASQVEQTKTLGAREALLDADNYSLYRQYGSTTWSIQDDAVLEWANAYFEPIISAYGFRGVNRLGFVFHLAEEEEPTALNKLTFYLYTYDNSGEVYFTTFPYFDLGGDGIAPIDEYLSTTQYVVQ